MNFPLLDYYIDSHYSLLFESRVFKGLNIIQTIYCRHSNFPLASVLIFVASSDRIFFHSNNNWEFETGIDHTVFYPSPGTLLGLYSLLVNYLVNCTCNFTCASSISEDLFRPSISRIWKLGCSTSPFR